jgi:hypothetical protein
MTLNAATPYYPDFAFPGEPSRQRRNRIALGVALSLVLHALLLAAYRNKPTPVEARDLAPSRSIAVWLRPLPAAVPEREPEPAAQVAPPRPAVRAERQRRRVIAVTPEPAAPPRPEPFAVEPDPAPTPANGADAPPRFDPDAARKMARQLASSPDPARADTAVGQFPAKPYATETRAARAISQTRRRDCKDGLPGGLLGPLIILMDKKDSGCQW